MSTYKKRGVKKSKIFSDKSNSANSSATADVFESLDTGASKAENIVAKYQNYIIIFIGLITISVLGYLGYLSYIFEPSKNEASSELNQSQYYFNLALNETDSPAVSDSLFLIALEGGEGRYGFLDIISNYSGTPAAEIAEYSAGMIYIKLKVVISMVLVEIRPKTIIFCIACTFIVISRHFILTNGHYII